MRSGRDCLPALPDALALDHFLSTRRQADPDGFVDLSLAVVKMLGSGEYVAGQAVAPGTATAGSNASKVERQVLKAAGDIYYKGVSVIFSGSW